MSSVRRKSFELRWLLPLTLLTCGTTWAQSPAKTNSGIEILKLKLEKQTRLPRNFDPSVIPENGIFSTMEASTTVRGSTQAPFGDEARQAAANRSAALGPVDSFPNAPSRMPIFYLYSLTIRNIGDRHIQGVAWDFVFLDSTSGAVVGDHRFLSYRTIRNGETLTLQGTQRSRPISVVPATAKSEKDSNSVKTLQRAIIQCVLYADGTTWKNPLGREGVCEALKNNKPVHTKKPAEQLPK